jgi:Predicted Zn-dependent peptidases
MRAIASILNNRIYDQIREIHGLSYDPSVEYNAYSTFGYISASAGGSPSKLNRIRKLMLQEFQKLKNGKIEREELENVKRGLEIKYALDTDDTLETATRITEMELMYGDGRMYGKMPRMIKRLNADSLERIASSYISMKRYGMITLSRE